MKVLLIFISSVFMSNVYAFGSPFGSLNPNNPFSEYSSPFGKYNPNNPFSEGIHPTQRNGW